MEISNSPSNILFLDIETIPKYQNLEEAPETYQSLWKRKENALNQWSTTKTIDYKRAGIYAEYGKIICISCGQIKYEDSEYILKITTFSSNDEMKLLTSFFSFLKDLPEKTILCAHNGKEFDFPYICRRGLIQNLILPDVLNISGKKPWEIKHLDTLEMWKFGDYKNFTSLDVLANLFGIESPKKEMSGEDVYHYYYEKKDLKSIRSYCENDVVTLASVFLYLSQKTEYLPKHIEVERRY